MTDSGRFVSTEDIPKTDEDVEAFFHTRAYEPFHRELIGLYRIYRIQGIAVVEALALCLEKLVPEVYKHLIKKDGS